MTLCGVGCDGMRSAGRTNPQARMRRRRWMGMRTVLEWMGLVAPDRSRREPVAVPAWAPYAVAFAGALLAGFVALCAWALLHALFA